MLGDGVVTKLVEGPHLSVHAAADGRVWAGRTAGQIEVHGDTATAPQITLPSRSDVRAITEDADGGIWFGSARKTTWTLKLPAAPLTSVSRPAPDPGVKASLGDDSERSEHP